MDDGSEKTQEPMTFGRRFRSSQTGGASSPELPDERRSDRKGDHGESITLPGNWTGRVLTARPPRAPSGFGHGGLPKLGHWERLLTRLLDDPTALSDYEVLKHSDKGEVFRARFSWEDRDLNVVCKQSRTRGFWRGLAARWRESKEKADFDRGLALIRAGIATALPLAVIGRKSPVREAWLITEFLVGAVDLDQLILTQLPRLTPNHCRHVKNAIVRSVADFFVSVQQHGYHHRDLKASNIILTNWESHGEPVCVWLVDLEGLQPGGSSSEQNRWQPLMRLAASLLGYAMISRSDYCRFLQTYLRRAGLPRDGWKEHYRSLAARATDYARRAQSRKTHKLDGYTDPS